MDRLQELVRLHRMGTGAREVARLLGMSPNTEREYRRALQAGGMLEGEPGELPSLEALRAAVEGHLPAATPPQMVSSVEPWMARILELAATGLRPQGIYDRLRTEQEGFSGTYWAVRQAYRRWRRERGVQPEDVAIPVETRPGEVAQVDFGYVGRLYDAASGQVRKAWAFVMVLGHSRHMVVRVVFDQRVETWLQLHAEAFAELGGVVETVVPDNLKAAVIRAAFGVSGGATALNRSYREFARHYGFKVDPTPVRAPKKKGKVESAVKYVKHNFFAGRHGADVDEVRAALAVWVREVAGLRQHGTTRRRPAEVFAAEEQAALQPLPRLPFEPVEWKQATVHRDSHVSFDRRLYSVPWRLIGKTTWIRATPTSVAVYADDVRVATHSRRGADLRVTVEDHLPPERACLRHRSREYWEARADRLDPGVGAYVREVFDSDDVLSMLRPVQAIVTHLETFPVQRAVAAVQRARFYGNYTYAGVKAILRQGLDLQPLPLVTAPPAGSPQAPLRFARSMAELIHQPLENTHEPN